MPDEVGGDDAAGRMVGEAGWAVPAVGAYVEKDGVGKGEKKVEGWKGQRRLGGRWGRGGGWGWGWMGTSSRDGTS